ncbi:hypothetical protein SeMB42_g05245 [Synchytrium endobioticum]|uniref:Uncharacterized protein n=1 Tax=Synchytrium endobioticum TaxID=286115 RepID=A0A507CT00_9FUNG|nr:hypothetical protein SeMB42_g05245 [Synchytrium endobioticum]
MYAQLVSTCILLIEAGRPFLQDINKLIRRRDCPVVLGACQKKERYKITNAYVSCRWLETFKQSATIPIQFSSTAGCVRGLRPESTVTKP